MKVSDWIANRCKELNPHTFLFVGGGNMYLADSLGRVGTRLIHMHHEQALAMAAESYARITNKPSVCVVTTGPGGINAINGVFGAWVDSIPMLIVSGQVRTDVMKRGTIRQIGDQEAPIVDIVKSITKFARVCMRPEDVEWMFELALREAVSGRPGPVWLDIPLDVQRAEFIPSRTQLTLEFPYPQVNVQKIVNRLRAAKKPVIIAGNGIRLAGALDLFTRVMDKINVPIIPNFDARDLMDFEHYAFGLVGNNTSNEILHQADFILSLGCRMGIRQVGWDIGKFGQKKYTCMVDIDRDELDKHVFVPNEKVQMDVKTFLFELNKLIKTPIEARWVKGTPRVLPKWNSAFVDPYEFVRILNSKTEEGNIVALANGTMPTVVLRYLNMKPGMRMILNNGCGSMGYGLPAAIGAAYASGKPVYCMEGDGSIQLNIQELQTIRNLPIRIFLFNNNGYNSIRNTQDAYFEGFHVGADPSCGLSFPSIQRIAEAYQIQYYSASSNTNLESAINNILWGNMGPAICELMIDPNFKMEKSEI